MGKQRGRLARSQHIGLRALGDDAAAHLLVGRSLTTGGDDDETLPLFDGVALSDQHAHDASRHGRRDLERTGGRPAPLASAAAGVRESHQLTDGAVTGVLDRKIDLDPQVPDQPELMDLLEEARAELSEVQEALYGP